MVKIGATYRNVLWIGLVFALFAGLQGGKYFLHNRMQELGIALALMLYVQGAYLSAFRMEAFDWWKWVVGAPGFCLFVMITWSAIFSLKAGVAITPSIFASREFMLLLLAPVIFFLHIIGMSISRLVGAIMAAASLTLVSYLFFYFYLDLEAAYFSTDAFTHHLVTYDESRGFRLKPPTYSMIIVFLSGFFTIFGRGSTVVKSVAIVALIITCYIWSLVMLRAVAAGLLVSVLLYAIVCRKQSQAGLAIVATPLVILLIGAGTGIAMDIFVSAHGAEVRLASFKLALDEFSKNWLLGWGQSSGYTKTYQDLFGPKFFPSDLGIIGILFKYGVVGGLTYVSACFSLFFISVRTHWRLQKCFGVSLPLIQALVVFTTLMTLNMILWPGLAYGQGLTMASVIIGLSACIKRFTMVLESEVIEEKSDSILGVVA